MAKKYIIKNCPACHNYWKDEYICEQLKDTSYERCKDCTDCLLKLIVKKCKEAESAYFTTGNTDMFISGRNNFASNILAMLEIQECE